VLATLIVLSLVGAGGYVASRQLYFIGTNQQGIVTVFRGFPYDLFGGIRLYETYYVSGVPASVIPAIAADSCSTISCALSRTPPISSTRSSSARSSSERPQPRAGRPDPASLLVTAGFAGVFIQRSNALSNISLTYGAIFLALCVAAHIFIRVTLPNADPYLFPLVAVLASFGLVMVYRIDSSLARQPGAVVRPGADPVRRHDR